MRRCSTRASGLSLGEAVEAPLRGLERAERDGGAMARVIVCGLRHHDAGRLDGAGASWRSRTSIAASSGSISPAVSWEIRRRLHAAAFAYAREHDLACTCHAGEGADASSVRDAVHVCGAHRIGHATRLIEDESLTQYVNDRRIALEICLTSNVQTHAVESYEEHPLRAYFDRGMNVVLNTDNRLMSGTTLTDEYVHAATRARLHVRRAVRDRAERIRERVPSVGGARGAARSRARPRSPRSRRGARVTTPFGAAAGARRPRRRFAPRLAARTPDVAIVLGSGLGGLADEIDADRDDSVSRDPGVSRRRRSSVTPAR